MKNYKTKLSLAPLALVALIPLGIAYFNNYDRHLGSILFILLILGTIFLIPTLFIWGFGNEGKIIKGHFGFTLLGLVVGATVLPFIFFATQFVVDETFGFEFPFWIFVINWIGGTLSSGIIAFKFSQDYRAKSREIF